ncbi:MAG: Gfo/Idh/MocA family protein [Promethearchaeota archaeon]
MRFGIIGFGIFGEKRLVPGFEKSKGELIAISKRKLSVARMKAKQYEIPYYYDDPAELVRNDEIDAVFIASPNNLHAAHVKLAATNRKHVICEKPMAFNVLEAKEMAASCVKNDVRFMIAQCYRYAGSCLKIKEIVDSGKLGEIHYIHAHYSFKAERSPRKWIFDRDIAGGGPTFDIGVHMVDLVRFLLKDRRLIAISGRKKYYNKAIHPNRTVEASGSLKMILSGETEAFITCSFELPYLTSIDIYGTKGFLSSRYFSIVEKDALIKIFTDDDLENPKLSFNINNGNFYAKEIDHFIDFVKHPEKNPDCPSYKDGILNQIILHYWNNTWKELKGNEHLLR